MIAGGSGRTNLRVKTPGHPGTEGPPQYCVIYSQELNQIPAVNSREKLPQGIRHRGKEPILKYAKKSVLNKTYPQGKLTSYFIEYQQADSKVHMERQQTKNSQHKIEGEKQYWGTDST